MDVPRLATTLVQSGSLADAHTLSPRGRTILVLTLNDGARSDVAALGALAASIAELHPEPAAIIEAWKGRHPMSRAQLIHAINLIGLAFCSDGRLAITH